MSPPSHRTPDPRAGGPEHAHEESTATRHLYAEFMGSAGPAHDDTAPVYVISIAARLAGMHPQTLRSYDRLGLVKPGRTSGRGRRYSVRDVQMLREVQRLSQEEGINLEGIRRILQLGSEVMALRAQVQELAEQVGRLRAEADRRVAEAHASHRRDLVPVERTAVVVWHPKPRP